MNDCLQNNATEVCRTYLGVSSCYRMIDWLIDWLIVGQCYWGLPDVPGGIVVLLQARLRQEVPQAYVQTWVYRFISNSNTGIFNKHRKDCDSYSYWTMASAFLRVLAENRFSFLHIFCPPQKTFSTNKKS